MTGARRAAPLPATNPPIAITKRRTLHNARTLHVGAKRTGRLAGRPDGLAPSTRKLEQETQTLMRFSQTQREKRKKNWNL